MVKPKISSPQRVMGEEEVWPSSNFEGHLSGVIAFLQTRLKRHKAKGWEDTFIQLKLNWDYDGESISVWSQPWRWETEEEVEKRMKRRRLQLKEVALAVQHKKELEEEEEYRDFLRLKEKYKDL